MRSQTAPQSRGAPWKTAEAKVLIGLIVALGLGEFTARTSGERISADLRHLHQLSDAPARIKSAEEKGEESLLIVGNSLARNGIDRSQVESKFGSVVSFTPDGSSVSQWAWGLRKYFLLKGARPDEIWLMTGRAHLLDFPVSPEKLGGHYVSAGDLLRSLAAQPSGEDRSRLLLGWSSKLFAVRDRVRPIIGYGYLPGFEVAWPAIAALKGDSSGGEKGAGEMVAEPENLDSLGFLVEEAREVGVDIKVFVVPTPAGDSLPEVVRRFLRDESIPFYEFPQLEALGPERFPDGYHLDEKGAEIFTRAIMDVGAKSS